MATIKDVAELAKVSTATVSRVINNHPSVTVETRDNVHKAMDKLCYLPSRSAIQLNGKKSGILAALVPNLSNPHFDELVMTLEEEARYYGMNLIIKTHQNDIRVEKSAIQNLISLGVEGLFWVPTSNEAAMADLLQRSSINTVVVTQRSKFFDSVLVDSRVGASLAAQHLIDLGYNNIGFIGQQVVDDEKFSVFNRCLEQNGLAIDAQNLLWVNKGSGESLMEQTEDVYNISRAIINNPQPNRAYWIYNDVFAVSLVRQLADAGVKVPEDIAVISFDDTYLSQLLNITSVTQPIREIGRLAYNMIRTPQTCEEINCIELRPRLVARETTLNIRKTQVNYLK
ncbi:LacI family DNA-binding transcriptional regulator [Vibrio vulnificus]|nr:LacI family DNA-binding transcriptional regulator [Vibrio vulnificus]